MIIAKPDIIYVDLDALLDTRLATLARVNPEYAFNAMKANYFTREIDSFPDLDYESFYNAYSKRDSSVLKLAVLTNIFSLLMSFVKSQIEDLVKGGQNNGIEIRINTYPYKLSQQEVMTLMEIVQIKLAPEVSISNIHLDDKALTPSYCKEHFAAMVRYSFHEWVELHVEEWMKVKMPSVAVYAPALYVKLPDEKAKQEFKEMKLHPFQATEIAAAPLFALRLLDIEMFSINSVIKNRMGVSHSVFKDKTTLSSEK